MSNSMVLLIIVFGTFAVTAITNKLIRSYYGAKVEQIRQQTAVSLAAEETKRAELLKRRLAAYEYIVNEVKQNNE